MQANSIKQHGDSNDQDVVDTVAALVRRARTAQAVYARYDQVAVDEVVVAVAWTLLEPATNRRLSEQAVADTGLGRVADKITKNHRKTLGLLRDLKRARSVGVVAEYPEKGLIEIARPVGVVGAVVPSTNPVATPYNKTLNALKGGNAVILACSMIRPSTIGIPAPTRTASMRATRVRNTCISTTVPAIWRPSIC